MVGYPDKYHARPLPSLGVRLRRDAVWCHPGIFGFSQRALSIPSDSLVATQLQPTTPDSGAPR
jgi:hypothetical protein